MSSCSRRRLSLGLAAWLTLPALARETDPDPAPSTAPTSPAASSASAVAANAKPPLLGVDPASFRATDLDWRDDTRQRAVPVRLYLPTTPAQKRPLLVFSHGIGGSRRGYSYLGAYLASQGLAVLHVQHVGSDRELWFGNPLKLVGRLQGAAQEAEALARVRDVRFALDQLLQGEWAGEVDAQRIAAAGHSYGANTTLLLAGARVVRDGQPLALRDERIRAAVLISAPPFYGEADPAAILGGIQMPTLHITATDDVIQIPGYRSPAEDRIRVFDAVGGPVKALAMFNGGSHSVFTDRSGTGGVALNPRIKQATRELVAGFVAKVLDGRGVEFESWPQRHRELLARWSVTSSS